MPFPLTHMCIALRILKKLHPDTEIVPGYSFLKIPKISSASSCTTGELMHNRAQFILGSVAPDAVHFRKEFKDGASQSEIGPTKKVTHLCPISDEKWGFVTDNHGWIEKVCHFMAENTDNPLAIGYGVHVLTDISNNLGPWNEFRTNYPEEAAKGYASGIYTDLKNIDTRIYHELYKNSEIIELLQKSIPAELPSLVSFEEVEAIKHNLLNQQYNNIPTEYSTDSCTYLTYERTLEFIEETACFCLQKIDSINDNGMQL